jgi:3-hexulose-6-phosphate synthase/6-phospho-3-hexuloisomerase
MEAAAKAGANIAIVLGGASDATVKECIEAGRNYGIAVAMDLLGAADPVERAKQAQDWGIAEIHVHLPIDEQMQGRTPFDLLKSISDVATVPVGVAGGLHSGNVVDAAAAGADILVIGGSITKAEDANAATREIVTALETGEAKAPRLFKRGGEAEILDVLRNVSAANLSDALHRGGVAQGIKPLTSGLRLAGRAVTVRTFPGDWAKPVEAIDLAGPGDVIVVDCGGVPPAIWGELATNSAMNRKIEGLVVDGAIRDSGDIRETGFPVFTRHVVPNAGEPKGFGEIGVTVNIGGLRVSPGDLILGDDDGVVVVPKDRAVEFANRAMDVLERENRIRAEIVAGSTLSKVVELLRWEKKR